VQNEPLELVLHGKQNIQASVTTASSGTLGAKSRSKEMEPSFRLGWDLL